MEKEVEVTNERSLHSSIKEWYALPGDRFEVRVNDYIVDIMRADLLIEIQTRNFSAVRKKLRNLAKDHRVHLVYPIAKRKWIVHLPQKGQEVLSRRRSPKEGRLTDVFDELIRIPDLFNEGNFSIEVLMIEEEEIRRRDGKGSWRRRGMSIEDRKLIRVVEGIAFNTPTDFLRFLPRDLGQPFTNKSLAKASGIPLSKSRRITYSLRKMGTIKEVGKNQRELLFMADALHEGQGR